MSELITTLQWEENFDNNDNTTFEAASAAHDDGCPFHWRIVPILFKDDIGWDISTSDDELICGLPEDYFTNIADAKLHCQSEENEMIEAFRTELPQPADDEERRC